MFKNFENEINQIIKEKNAKKSIGLLQPPLPELGDFCIVVNQFAGKNDPKIMASDLLDSFVKIPGIENVEIYETKGKKKRSGIVYLNFKIKPREKRNLQVKYLSHSLKHIFSEEFAQLTIGSGKNAIVEHTSANPISPLHVGNLRNSIHGDTLARILDRLGYQVHRHFYINDVGLQIAFVTIGYEILKNQNVKPEIKFDLWLGRVYAIMHNLYYIQSLKRTNSDLMKNTNYKLSQSEIEVLNQNFKAQIKDNQADLEVLSKKDKLTKEERISLKELKKKNLQLDKNLAEIKSLKINFDSLSNRFPRIHKILYSNVSKIDLIELSGQYLKAYETKLDKKIVTLSREITDWVLEAFKWTLKRFNIDFDNFDYESDLTWSKKPNEIIKSLEKSANTRTVDGSALRYSYPTESIVQMYEELELDPKSIPIKGNIPELQLRRKDGTALYAPKDIAYSIQKYESSLPHLIFNVISSEQILPQFQLLLPLFELGYKELTRAMKHYSYELVELKGRPMSGRRAIYVTADEYYDETLIRARMAKRASDQQRGGFVPNNLEQWDDEMNTLRKVTIASTRFPLIETSPNRKIILDLDRELDFKRNSGPFVQYAHARACGILRKLSDQDNISNLNIDYNLLCDDEIIFIVQHIMKISKKLTLAVDELDPSVISNWLISLAKQFMKFYEKFPIHNAENEDLKEARIKIVKAVQTALFEGLNILGIPAADRI
ncbi:MAG: Arginine--tRNA ligase [Candidatus Heimdallarchaeota archaeon LC_2]|nr:MAG: Arginine--tRNA ligase [Candidatus Heimdallarchaeota archaeon LC_2]